MKEITTGTILKFKEASVKVLKIYVSTFAGEYKTYVGWVIIETPTDKLEHLNKYVEFPLDAVVSDIKSGIATIV